MMYSAKAVSLRQKRIRNRASYFFETCDVAGDDSCFKPPAVSPMSCYIHTLLIMIVLVAIH